jgi:branched-chain amino acid aminotransferase
MLKAFTPDSSLPAQPAGWDEELGFEYREADAFWMACWTASGGWEPGRLYEHQGARFELSPGANVFQYGQGIVEGLKARRSAGGPVSLFRPVDHARRLRQSAAYLAMQAPPVDEIVQAVQATVQANGRWVPAYGRGSLYVRPAIIGSGTVLGVRPASEYLFYVFTSPVGGYLGSDRLLVLSGVHRAAPHGIGTAKAAGNYAASLRPQQIAHERGYADVLYLDARESRYIEELSGATFMVILKDGTMVAPSLGSILPGITRDSIITLAREVFGWTVVERRLSLDEVLHDAAEAFYTGTATILAPVTTINVMGVDHPVGTGEVGARAMQLRKLLDQIQAREQPDLWGWLVDVP